MNCGELAIAVCPQCGFVCNAAFRADLMSYCPTYDNTQTHSPLFRRYLEGVANGLLERYRIAGQTIVEVGCGKGDFLRLLCAGGRNRGRGFDPSYIGPASDEKGAVQFVTEFYEGQPSDQPPALVCCRHVIEHIPAPLEMLRGVRRALGDASDAVVYFETPDVRWILGQVAFWDFFYEHCSYFSPDSLAWAFEAAGFHVLELRNVFDGQYLSIEARPKPAGTPAPAPPTNAASRLREQITGFGRSVATKVDQCRDQVVSWSGRGGCALWGAAAKGVTFANVIDPDLTYLKCVVDINPAKAGRYVPGTGHPIVGLDLLGSQYSLAGLLSVNSNYLEEQRAMLSSRSLPIPVEPLR